MAIYRMLRDQRIEGERASMLAAAYELALRALAVKKEPSLPPSENSLPNAAGGMPG